MKKSILSLFLLMSFAAAFTSCNENEPSKSESEETSQKQTEKIKITVYQYNGVQKYACPNIVVSCDGNADTILAAEKFFILGEKADAEDIELIQALKAAEKDSDIANIYRTTIEYEVVNGNQYTISSYYSAPIGIPSVSDLPVKVVKGCVISSSSFSKQNLLPVECKADSVVASEQSWQNWLRTLTSSTKFSNTSAPGEVVRIKLYMHSDVEAFYHPVLSVTVDGKTEQIKKPTFAQYADSTDSKWLNYEDEAIEKFRRYSYDVSVVYGKEYTIQSTLVLDSKPVSDTTIYLVGGFNLLRADKTMYNEAITCYPQCSSSQLESMLNFINKSNSSTYIFTLEEE